MNKARDPLAVFSINGEKVDLMEVDEHGFQPMATFNYDKSQEFIAKVKLTVDVDEHGLMNSYELLAWRPVEDKE